MWKTQIYHVCAAACLRFNYGAYINTIIIIIMMVILMLVVMAVVVISVEKENLASLFESTWAADIRGLGTLK